MITHIQKNWKIVETITEHPKKLYDKYIFSHTLSLDSNCNWGKIIDNHGNSTDVYVLFPKDKSFFICNNLKSKKKNDTGFIKSAVPNKYIIATKKPHTNLSRDDVSTI